MELSKIAVPPSPQVIHISPNIRQHKFVVFLCTVFSTHGDLGIFSMFKKAPYDPYRRRLVPASQKRCIGSNGKAAPASPKKDGEVNHET